MYAPQGQHFRSPAFSARNGQGTSGIHAHQPVGQHPGACGIPQRGVGRIVPNVVQRDANRLVIKRGKPDTEHRATIGEMFKHLVNKKLPFAIRIAGIDNGSRVTQQFPDELELGSRLLLDDVFPGRRNDGQMLAPPLRIFRRVGFGPCRFKKVSEAPGNAIVTAPDMPVFRMTAAKPSGDGLSKTGFSAMKSLMLQPHALRGSRPLFLQGVRIFQSSRSRAHFFIRFQMKNVRHTVTKPGQIKHGMGVFTKRQIKKVRALQDDAGPADRVVRSLEGNSGLIKRQRLRRFPAQRGSLEYLCAGVFLFMDKDAATTSRCICSSTSSGHDSLLGNHRAVGCSPTSN